MAFESVNNNKVKKSSKVSIGHIVQKKESDSLYLKIDPNTELVLYDKASGKYYQLRKGLVKILDESKHPYCFELLVNLDDENQVELLG